eukprot:7819482-Pyramimonas_sp.AAC.1
MGNLRLRLQCHRLQCHRLQCTHYNAHTFDWEASELRHSVVRDEYPRALPAGAPTDATSLPSSFYCLSTLAWILAGSCGNTFKSCLTQ